MSASEDDVWLETEADADDATGPAAAGLLQSIAQTLAEAPESKRYHVELSVQERDRDD